MAPKKRARRGRGEGSIYQNKDGSYTVAIRIDGKLIRRRAANPATAEATRKELIAQRDAGINLGEGRQTVQAWLNSWYTQKARTLKPKTLGEYRRIIEAYILPVIGTTPLDRLRAGQLQALINGVEDDIRAQGNDTGKRTAQAVGRLLRAAMQLAAEQRVIPYSPMNGVTIPEHKAAKVVPPTEAQIGALLWHAEGDALEPLWHLYALLGLRRGEGLGLRWRGYDAAAQTIAITQQVQEIEGVLVVGSPKSDAGERTLPLSPAVCALLDARRAMQLRQRVKRGSTWVDHDLIFANRDGGPLWPRNVEDEFYRLRAWAGLPTTTTLHHLRRAVATLLDEQATEVLKAEILGHEKKTITQRYTAARLDAMRRALARVEVAIAEARKAG